MLWAVLSIFVLAAVAPFIARVTKQATGWVLGLLPLAVFAYFAQQIGPVADGTPIRQVHAWVPSLDLTLSFYLDGLSLLFALLVTGIGTLIVVYAGGYMHGHDQYGRFFSQLLLFMGAMLGLVVADNIIAFFIFFELTSFASYLLIGFYHTDEDNRRAARKALVVTGGGGLALLAGLLLLQQVTGTMEFSEMLALGDTVRAHPYYTGIFVLVILGAFTKSAQFPFHFWLPAAMAGPTPVSAYLHSATMVKAGVFLLARLSPVLGGTDLWLYTLVSFGAFTMVLSAWLGLRYTDLKQILAYTTVMVLGLLTMLLGVGTSAAVKAAMVFILVHALYKGALFMMAGSVDHETGTRDVLELGGLRSEMPYTMAGGLLAALSMAGLPPLFGFIGKEVTYEAALGAGPIGIVVLVASVLANAALLAGALVVGIKPFFGAEGAFTRHPHEAPVSMWLGPGILATLGLAFGLVPSLVDQTILQAATGAVLQSPYEFYLALWHGINAPLIASLVTFAIGFALYVQWARVQPSGFMQALDGFFGQRPAAAFERGLFEMARLSQWTTRRVQNGTFRHYLLTVLATFVVLVGSSLLLQTNIQWPMEVLDVRYYEAALAGTIVLAALVAVRTHERFIAILALSIGGYAIALLYLLFGAPDLAMTQFTIETLSVIILVIVLLNLPGISGQVSLASRVRDAVVATGVGAIITMIALTVLSTPLDRYVSDYLASRSYTEARGHNIVNVILVDFRALDTMAEIAVLAMAALGVYVLMRMMRQNRDTPEASIEPDDKVLTEAEETA